MEIEVFRMTDKEFSAVDRALRKYGERFGLQPSELLTAILLGRIQPVPQPDDPVTMNVHEDVRDRVLEAIRAWPETHDGEDFGTFVVRLALGRYDLVEAPPERPRRTNGHRRPTCRVCGRPLTSPEAIAKGIGPVCEARLQTQAA